MTWFVRLVGRVVLLVGAGAAAAMLAPGSSGAEPRAELNSADGLTYTIRTRHNTGNGCANERVKSAVVGVPSLVDVGGLLTPDLVVELVVVPALPGVTDTTTLNLIVTKLAAGRLPVLVEAILAPEGTASAERVAFGFDACDATAPGRFNSTIVSQPTRLSVDATTLAPGTSLTLLGSSFSQVGNNRVNPTAVSARLTPVPSSVNAVVDEIGSDRYHAKVTMSAPAKANVSFVHVTNTTSEAVNATIDQLPTTLSMSFGPTAVSYSASAPIRKAIVDVTTTATGSDTQRVSAHLIDLPAAGSFEKDGASHATFQAHGRVGEATVRIASYTPGASLPAAVSRPHQYLVADRRATYDVVDFKLLGLAAASAGWGDPITVNLDHQAGPFDLVVTTADHVTTATVLDLPAQVQFSYSPATQALTYSGSAIIAELTLDHVGDDPLFETATEAHVVARQIPLGLSLRFDEPASTLTANLTDGTLGLLEIQLTSGPDERLPEGVKGLKVVQRLEPAVFTAFVRLAGIAHAEVGWGDPLRVNLNHAGGPFTVSVLTQNVHNDVSINTRTVDAKVEDLPAVADLTYSPASQKITYVGSAVIDRLQADVVNDQDAISGRATELHLLALGIPTRLDLTMNFESDDNASFSANLPDDQQLDFLELQLTDGPDDRLEPTTADGLLFEDLDDRYVLFARVTGLQRFHYAKSVSPTSGDGSTSVTTVSTRLLGGRDLRLDLRKSDETKPDGVEYLEAEYFGPPEEWLLFIRENVNEDGDDWFTEFVYSSQETGESLEASTNRGKDRTFLDMSITPVPQVASACISGDFAVCSSFDQPEEDAEQSYSFHVSEPVRLEFTDCKESRGTVRCDGSLPNNAYSGRKTLVGLDIDKAFTIMTEEHHINNDFDSTFVHMDTGGEPLSGRITKRTISAFGTDVILEVNLPEGFLAEDRYAEIACTLSNGGFCESRNAEGKLVCPSGTEFVKDLPLFDEEHFEDEYCPAPRVDSVSPGSLPQGATDRTIELTGTNFSPGAFVAFRRPGQLTNDDSVTVQSVQWIDVDHIQLVVSVDEDADTGLRDIFVRNPVDGAGSFLCGDCFRVT